MKRPSIGICLSRSVLSRSVLWHRCCQYWRLSQKLLLLLSIGCLSACSFFGAADDASKTLADLPSAKIPHSESQVEVVDIDRIEASYRKALTTTNSTSLRQQILLRLADLEMTRSEQQQFSATEMRHFYDRPIAMYQDLIATQLADTMPITGISVDQLRYKLAKAYSLDGRNDEAAQVLQQLAEQHPNSPFIAETQFRRADKAFAEGDYQNAERYFASVVAGDNPSLQQNALYMQGWAQFKRGDYELALVSFTQVMDQLLVAVQRPEQVPSVLASLGQARTNLVADTLRVMSLSLANLDGAKTIVTLQKEQGQRAWQHLLYEQLGQLYLEQERFSDSAKTYQKFVANNPKSNFAPDFSIRTISVYQQGDFPSLILPAKQEFVERYGIRSDFWTERSGAIGTGARQFLYQSLQELALYEHAEAQRLKAAAQSQAAIARYAKAAVWYREFVQTFPQDAQVASTTFLLAEALYEAGDLEQALAAYEKVAYHYQDPVKGAEAGYSAILLAQELIASAQPSLAESQHNWQLRKIDNALRFARDFSNDKRAVAVLAQAAPELLSLARYQDAITVAERVLAWQPSATGQLLLSAWLVAGHSRFELGLYAQAEQAYWQVLELLPQYGHATESVPKLPTIAEVRERIAASIYQQAQTALMADDKAQAVKLLLRITEVTPATEVALKARFDAGHYLLELERWAEAEAVLLAFRKQYPDHSLTAAISAKLVVIYQQQHNWQAAADELVLMERNSTDPDVKRQALIMGAELYEKAGQRSLAIEQYRLYANDYPHPIAENMEAQYRLTQLYEAATEQDKRTYWLQQLVASDRKAGAERSDRSRYLAASAATELAQPAFDEFVRLPLRLPLNVSLQRKRAALEQALAAQEQVLTYGVAEYTTQASFKIGEIYAQLSRALMNSQRPPELDTLELEQYDMLLEEQAYPFEEKAIAIHEANARRSHPIAHSTSAKSSPAKPSSLPSTDQQQGLYDIWVQRSFAALATLLPARYHKPEQELEISHELY